MPPQNPLEAMKKKSLPILFFIVFACPASLAFAITESVPISAQLAFPLETQGGDARAIAMGSAFVAVGGEASALLWNPAGLSRLSTAQLALHHKFYLQDLMQDTLVFATPQGSFGSWGLSASYISYGSLQGRDSNGVVTGNFNAGRMGGEIAWAHPLFSGLSVGLGLKGNLLTLSGTSFSNVAGDAGILWDLDPSFHLGASFSNWGTDVATYIANSVVRIGGAYNWTLDSNHHALLAGSASIEPFGTAYLNFGAEDLIGNFLALRAGCNLDLSNNYLQGLTSLTAGVGFYFQDFSLDYAYSPFGDLGSSHQLSLAYRFEPTHPTPAPTPLPKKSALQTSNPQTPTLSKPVTVMVIQPQQIVPTATAIPSAAKPDAEKLKLFFSLPGSQPETQAIPDSSSNQKIQALKDVIAKDPGDNKAWYQLGSLYYKQGQKEEAVQCFEQVLRLKPDNQKLRDWLTKYKGQ